MLTPSLFAYRVSGRAVGMVLSPLARPRPPTERGRGRPVHAHGPKSPSSRAANIERTRSRFVDATGQADPGSSWRFSFPRRAATSRAWDAARSLEGHALATTSPTETPTRVAPGFPPILSLIRSDAALAESSESNTMTPLPSPSVLTQYPATKPGACCAFGTTCSRKYPSAVARSLIVTFVITACIRVAPFGRSCGRCYSHRVARETRTTEASRAVDEPSPTSGDEVPQAFAALPARGKPPPPALQASPAQLHRPERRADVLDVVLSRAPGSRRK